MREKMMIKSKKKNQKLVRKSPNYEPYDIVIIVSEGTETEPNYFNALIDDERLSTTNVSVTGECGSDPVSVVNHAIFLIRDRDKDSNLERKIDRVYCLIDRDEHPNFDAAIDKIYQFNKSYGKDIIIPIRSYPCFEYWYICHFESTRKAFNRTGKKSPGMVCESYLNTIWRSKFNKDYSKIEKFNYNELKANLNSALKVSERSLKDALSIGALNPSTEIHLLVKYLINMRNPINNN